MRIVFIGQAPFGKESLQALVNQGEQVVGVLTVPDNPADKKPNPVKELAQQLGLPLLQPEKLRNPEAFDWVKALAPDLFVLAFVTDFVPQAMIDLAKYGGINYHPSLLPKYRGGSAINWAIVSGEKETGVTIHYIDEGVDTGDIIIQEKVTIEPEDNVATVYFNKLFPLGIKMIPEAVRLIREGKAPRIKQDESLASFQPVIKEKHCIMDWSRGSEELYNLVRGATPGPGATTGFAGQKVKILEARPVLGGAGGTPGSFLGAEGDGFLVATGDGALLVKKLAVDKNKFAAADFLTAYNPRTGDVFGG